MGSTPRRVARPEEGRLGGLPEVWFGGVTVTWRDTGKNKETGILGVVLMDGEVD